MLVVLHRADRVARRPRRTTPGTTVSAYEGADPSSERQRTETNDGRDDLKGMDTTGDDDPRAIPVRRYLRAPRQDVVDDRVGTIDDDRDSSPD